jgi:uncharacterized membrane protein YjgN (DUF898 family)
MTELKKILRWLTIAAMLQATLIFLVEIVLTTRLSTIASNLRDSLYKSNVAGGQVDQINHAFYSISNDLMWIFLAGMVLTSVGFGLLRSVIKKGWPKPSSPNLEGS